MNGRITCANRIKSVHRDVRVAADGVQLAATAAPHCRAREFSQAIQGRYESRPDIYLGLELVFRQASPGVKLQPMFHHTRVDLAPRLELTILAAIANSSRSRPRLKMIVRSERIEPGDAVRNSAALNYPEMKLPVLPGQSGIDSQSAGLARKPLRVRMPRVQPVRRIVRKPAVLSPADHQSPNETRTEAYQAPQMVTQEKAGRTEVSSIDVNGLTNKVIQAIDRRIIAQRERLGKI